MKKEIKNYIFIFLSITLFFAISSAHAQDPNQITNISTVDQNNQTELKFELSAPPQYKVFTIPNPERLVIDFNDAVLVANINDFSHPLFLSLRNNSHNSEQLRIVFDLKSSVKINRSTLTKSGVNKYYVTINLFPDDRNIYKKAPYKTGGEPINKAIYKKTDRVKYVVKNAKAPPTIIIDAGHGGKDPGTIGKFGKSKEKDITLGYARELKRQLDKTKKYKVFLTRDQDYFISLNERVDKARKVKADLFISLHADSSPDDNTSGLSIYSLSEKSSDKQAGLLAQKENKSDIIGGADFSDESGDILKTLINLSQRSTMNDSAKFAEIVIKSILENNIETLQKTHRFAGFRVLTAPDVPSVLIEMGYLSNQAEEKKLNSLQHKKEVSEALVDAVGNYFGN